MAFGGFGGAPNPFAAAAPANPFAAAAAPANPFAPAQPAANPFAPAQPAANPFAPAQPAANPFAPAASAANPFAPAQPAANPFAPQQPAANPFAPAAPAAAPNPFAPQQPAANPFAPAAPAAANPFAPAGTGGPAAVLPTGGDIQCPLPPGADSISAISWSPAQGVNHLAAASWDGYVRVWEIGRDPSNGAISQAATAGKAEQKVDGVSFLDCTWKEDGSHLFAVGTDNQVRMWNLQANTFNPIGSHAAPVRSCHWVKETQYLVTSGWDRQICVWDCRTNTPQGKISLNERVWACDVKYPWLVASTADKKVSIFNLASNPTTPYRTFDSPVAHQTRVVKIFHDQRTFAIGTIEGRVAVRYLDQATDTAIEPGTKDKLKYSFSFRCHRQGQLIFPVNCIDAHPRSEFHDVFATAGSDGLFVFWNKTKKMKLKEYPHLLGKHTISSFAFNAPGDLCAYAASYEWSKGPDGYNTTQQPTSLMVHQLTNEDLNGTPSR